MIKAGFSISIKVLFLATVVCYSFRVTAQPPQLKKFNYIEAHAEKAVRQMIDYRIPASVILAQAIYESSSGTSVLAQKSNNHFGIKCHRGWAGEVILKDDDTLNECFRSYSTIEESYIDHSRFLSLRPRYAPLFELPLNDYKNWCIGLKDAGYATSPGYAEQLIKIIEETGLAELDGPERLPCEIIRWLPEESVLTSRYSPTPFSLKEYSAAGLLWLEPGDIHLRSLDLIIEIPENDASGIAEK